MKAKRKNIAKKLFLGTVIGVVNGLFGAGGGMLAVPAMDKLNMSRKQAHANSVALIFPISAFSAFLYIIDGSVKFQDAWSYIPFGILGAGVGTLLLSKIPTKLLKKVFALFMIWAGVRLLFR